MCAQAITKEHKSVKALQKLKERGEPISTYISTHNQFTAIMVDPMADPPAAFENLLTDVPAEVRSEFAALLQDYTPPNHLAFIMDKKILTTEFMDFADGAMSVDEIARYISDKPNAGGGSGWVPYIETEWRLRMLIKDIGESKSSPRLRRIEPVRTGPQGW